MIINILRSLSLIYIPSHHYLTLVLLPLSIASVNLILEYYHSDFEVESKSYDSPVTKADQAAETLILKNISTHWPDIPIVAEEMCAAGTVPEGGSCFFLVDPLDGTKEFIKKRDEFTVNIALIHNGEPVFGVVFAPALGDVYISLEATKAGKLSLNQPFDGDGIADLLAANTLDFEIIAVRDWPDSQAIAVVSRSHIDDQTIDFLKKNEISERAPSGSSLKFCLLANGKADIYPRFGPTMEWDTAAGHAVLLAAGGQVVDQEGAPFTYGKFTQNYRNSGFIAGAKETLQKIKY